MGPHGPDAAMVYRGVAVTAEPGGVLDQPGTPGGQQRSAYVAVRRRALSAAQPPARALTSRAARSPHVRHACARVREQQEAPRATPRSVAAGGNRSGAAVRACSDFFAVAGARGWLSSDRSPRGGPGPRPRRSGEAGSAAAGELHASYGHPDPDTRRREAQPATQPAWVRSRRPRTTRRDQCRSRSRTPGLATGDLFHRADELIVARVLKERADLAHPLLLVRS
jgi:hypothetical protein